MKTDTVETTHLYEQLADKIAGLIRRGTLRVGERIPSVRRMSAQERVSISTALQAYFLLENRGLIEARPQSGFYVKQLSKRPPEPARSDPSSGVVSGGVSGGISDLVITVIEMNRQPDVVQLGGAMASAELFPNKKLHRTLAAAARRSGASSNVYDIPPGNDELRRQIALRAMAGGCSLGPDDIVITAGCTEALNLCLRAVAAPGDVIAVESPTYFVVLQIMESLGIRAVEIPTYPREGICLDRLTDLLSRQSVKACLLMPTVHNPLGASMPEPKRKKLVSILGERGIPLIEDDIYGDLHFNPRRPRAVKAFDKEGMVLLCSSFSKTLAPGYRVGWTAPGRYRKEVLRLKMVSSMGNPVLTQMMIADFLQNGGYDQHLRRIRKAYATQVEQMTAAIGRYFPEGTKVTRPSGGMLVWVEFPQSVNTLELHRQALERRISIAPGPMFSAARGLSHCARINCGLVWSDRLEDAVRTLGGLACRMC